MLLSNVTVIIRSVGERTVGLCHKLILEQGVPIDNIIHVNEAPFSKAMLKSFEIGIDKNLKWTFCIDGDVLLRSSSISDMIKFANGVNEKYCEIQGFVLDKSFGGARPAGNHLYRTSMLPLCMSLIPNEGIDIRPEGRMLANLAKVGHPWYQTRFLVGLHDFEQFNRDLFRKTIVYAHKHYMYSDLLLPYWRERLKHDKDYHIMLLGFSKGVQAVQKIYINNTDKLFSSVSLEHSFNEKSSLNLINWDGSKVDKIINEWEEPIEYKNKFPLYVGLGRIQTFRRRSLVIKIFFQNTLVQFLKIIVRLSINTLSNSIKIR